MDYAYLEYCELEIERADVLHIAQPGDNDQAVSEVLEKQYIQDQFDRITNHAMKKELIDYGAWEYNELNDKELNSKRILWLAAHQINDIVQLDL